MVKIVYNTCYGGFSLSKAACEMYKSLTGLTLECDGRGIDREDLTLVKIVEELGPEANGLCANLAITKLFRGTLYRIENREGAEEVMRQDYYSWRIAGASP